MKNKIAASNNIINTFKILKGNARVSVMFEPLWGIPFVLLNFYLSLYMKELGVTNQQLGYIIALGYIAGTAFSLFSGIITDRLGRKRTTLIFDFISWPLTITIYLISNSFLLFALATILNGSLKIVQVSWNLMVVEDADNEQRVAAFNLLNIINISSGIIIPFAGLLVNAYGVITSERIFLSFAVISMATMVIVRNGFYKETKIGQKILNEREKDPVPFQWKNILPIKAAAVFKGNPRAVIAAAVYILFLVYIPLGTFNSLYFAPFMTEVLDIDKSSISILGGVYSGVLLFILVFIIPAITRLNNTRIMQLGLLIQAASIFLLIMLPVGNIFTVILCIGIYAAGFGIFRPFLDTMLAEVTEGNARAGIYSLINTITCIITAMIGAVSGSIYLANPRILYVISFIILIICVILLAIYSRLMPKAVLPAGAGSVLQHQQQIGQ